MGYTVDELSEINQRIAELADEANKKADNKPSSLSLKPSITSSVVSSSSTQGPNKLSSKEVDDEEDNSLYGTPLGTLSYIEASTGVETDNIGTVDDILKNMDS